MSVLATQKGDKVILLGFTGIRLAEVEVSKATKKEITVIKSDGKEMVFDRETGIQTNTLEGKEKYANKIVHLSEDPRLGKKDEKLKDKPVKKKATPKKAAKKKVVEVIEEVDEDDEYEEL